MIDRMNGLRVDWWPRKTMSISRKRFSTLKLLLERRKITLVNTEPAVAGSYFFFVFIFITRKNQICCSLNSTCSSLSHSARVKKFPISFQIVPSRKVKPSCKIHCVIDELLYVSQVRSSRMTQHLPKFSMARTIQ